MIDGKYEYFAFISYKEEDAEWAKWLQRKLEHYKLPTTLRRENPGLPERISPIYEYKSEAGGGRLKEVIWKGLTSSKYLIVICSPRATKSDWLNNGIRYFVESGQEENIIPFIVEGKPKADNPDEECFPSELLKLTGDRELRGININEMGRDAAAVKVVSRMFDVKFDSLWQRYEKEKRRRRNWIIASVSALVLCILAVSGYIVSKNIELKSAYSQISQQNKELDEKNDSIASANKTILAANDSIIKQKAALERAYRNLEETQNKLERSNIDLTTTNIQLKDSRDSIYKTNQLLSKANSNLKEANTKIIRERNEILKAQSRYVAKEAKSLLENGDGMTAINLLLSVLPKDLEEPERPLVSAAELRLREAVDSISVPGWVSIGVIEDEERQINKFDYNPKDNLIVTNSEDGILRIWDAISLQKLASVSGFMSQTENLHFFGDSCVVAYGQDFIHIWNYRRGKHWDYSKQDVGDSICSVICSSDVQSILVANSQGIIKRINPNGTIDLVYNLGNIIGNSDLRCCVIENNLLLGLSTYDNGTLLFSVNVGNGNHTSNVLPFDLCNMSLSEDSQKILMYGQWGDVAICDATNLKLLSSRTVKSDNPNLDVIDYGHVRYINQCVWSEDDGNVYLFWSDSAISKCLSNLKSEVLRLPYFNSLMHSSTNRISSRGNRKMIIANIGDVLRIYRFNDSTSPDYCLYDGKENTISTAFFSNDGLKVYCTDLASSNINVIDVNKRQKIATLQGREDPYFYHTISFSPDGSILISASSSDMLMGKNNLLHTRQKDITMKDHIIVDGISNQDVAGCHPIRLYDTKTYEMLPFSGNGYMPSISDNNKYLISSEDGRIYRYSLESNNVPDTIQGYLPLFGGNQCGITYTSNNGSTFINENLDQTSFFQGKKPVISPNQETCITEGTTQIAYWDMSGNDINIYNLGRNIVSDKYFITDSILLIVTEGYGANVNGRFMRSNGNATPVYWLINLKDTSVKKKKAISGRFLSISDDKKEIFIDDGNVKVIRTEDLECVSELYLRNRSGYGEQFPLKISNDKTRIMYLNKDNKLMIHENVVLNYIMEKYRSVFHKIEMSEYLKQKYYLE